jgi:RNA polymerase sigma-54 factor
MRGLPKRAGRGLPSVMVSEWPGQGMDLQAGLQVELRALPGVLKALGMLALTHQEVQLATERSLAENPVLERMDGHPCPGCGRHVSSGTCYRCRGRGTSSESQFRDGTEAGIDPFRTLEAEAGLEVRSDCRSALEYVIAHLSPRGILDADPDEIARLHGLRADYVQEAVRALRAVGPPGIASTNVIALLTAQADALVEDRQAPDWLPRLVSEHLADLAAGSTTAVAKAMGITQAEAVDGLAIIRNRLRPFAAAEMTERDAPVPAADVFLYRTPDGSLEVEVPASAWFGLRIVDMSGSLRGAPEAKQWLAEHELAAQRLIYQVDRRADVLVRITQCAASQQKDFLDHGDGRHRPLTRTAVAQEIGLHPSTVSRAVRGKRLRLPSGEVADLSCLFGKGVATRTALQGLLTGGQNAVSDEALREQLSRRGFDIARRTVTKYRHSLR